MIPKENQMSKKMSTEMHNLLLHFIGKITNINILVLDFLYDCRKGRLKQAFKQYW